MINIVAKRMWFLTASTIILIVGILSKSVTKSQGCSLGYKNLLNFATI